MKQMFSYFKLCFKRSARGAVAMMLTVAVLASVLALTAVALISADKEKDDNQKIKIGIVGDLSDSFLQFDLLKLIKIDELSLSIDFIEMTEDEAADALNEFDISAYVFVPDKFVSRLAAGEDVKLSFVMASSSTDAAALISGETVQIISPLITESESGIYAMTDHAYSVGEKRVYEKNVELALRYINTLLKRAEAISVKSVGTDSLSAEQYFIVGIVTYLLFLFGVAAAYPLADKHLQTHLLLYSKGVRPWQTIICEYVNHTLIMYVFTLAAGGLLAYFSKATGLFDVSFTLQAFIRLLPYVLMISSIHLVISELVGGVGTYIITLFVSSTALAYISGVFYPYYFFPRTIQAIASVLPLGLTFDHLRASVIGKDAGGLMLCMIYTAAFILGSVILRRKNLRKEGL